MYITARQRKLASGVDLIKWERTRQIEEEGYDFEHDDNSDHEEGELAMAAVVYAMPVRLFEKKIFEGDDDLMLADPWPGTWDREYDKRKRNKAGILIPEKRSRKEIIHDLVKAGALIAAEIDRLLRIGKRKKK
jgi:hypothetical protein